MNPSEGDAAAPQSVAQTVHEIAHDLNNALLVIRGYSSLLHASLESPEHRADVDEIAKAVDHATSLTSRLLELGRAKPPEETAVGAGDKGTETILLVEDDQAVRELVRRVLEGAGYRVLLAERPSEAELVLTQEPSVDLLLSDVVMPEMSGHELAARVRNARPELRTLFMSGNAYVVSSSARVDAELLKKPFEPSELAQAVRRALDSGQVVTD